MARYWEGVVVVVVLLMAGQQCMSARTSGELLIKSMVEAQGLMLRQARGNDLAALTALASDVRISFVTGFNVSIVFNRVVGRAGDDKSFLGTGSRGVGVGTGLLFQLSNIMDTASYAVQPGTSSLDLHIMKFLTAEGDLVGAWLGRFAVPALVPAFEGPGTFTATA